MAVGWVLRKVMGKRVEPAGGSAQTDTGNTNSADAEEGYLCCRKSTWRWIITLLVSVQLLVFVLVSVPLRTHHGQATPLIQAPIMFMFKLERSAELIQSFKTELESNLSTHIHAPNMKVSLYSVKPIATQCAEVRFQLLPESSNSTYDVNELRKNLVKLFLRERNLPLTPTTFGKVYDFQINRIQGGITIIPEKNSLSKRSALFNFTLPNGTIAIVNGKFAEFKRQLHAGLCLRPNEVLITRLTNLNGSTIEQSVIVQNSVFKSSGRHLPPGRLKELAHRLNKHRRNFGLNHTVFGKVREVQLSPVLQHFLCRKHALGPAPAQAPGPGPASVHQAGYSYQPSHDHHQHSVFTTPAPAPAPVYSAIQAGFASSPAASQVVPDHSAPQQGIASVPAPSPSSSASNVESLSALIFVLVASVVSLFMLA